MAAFSQHRESQTHHRLRWISKGISRLDACFRRRELGSSLILHWGARSRKDRCEPDETTKSVPVLIKYMSECACIHDKDKERWKRPTDHLSVFVFTQAYFDPGP